MRYRNIERGNLLVSEIGMGCEGLLDPSLDLKHLLDEVSEKGVNCIDLYSPDPGMRKRLGEALVGRRDRYVIQGHLCAVWKDGQYKRTRDIEEVKQGFQEMLELLQTNYIDIGMIHYIDAEKDWNEVAQGGIMEYALQLKQQGIIRCIGMSSHNPLVALQAVDSGLIDVLMFSINPCYDLMPANEDVNELWNEDNYQDALHMDKDRELLYDTCQKQGVAITVMKAFGGGDLLDQELSPTKTALSVHQCMHYALTRPAVVSVMVGSKSMNEFMDCIAYEEADEKDKDYAMALASMPKVSWLGHCMYCGHCAPCPKGISVADVTKFLNLAKAAHGIPETVREHYAVLEHKASECIQCGMCETRCPFQVSIMENMKEAAQLFEASQDGKVIGR